MSVKTKLYGKESAYHVLTYMYQNLVETVRHPGAMKGVTSGHGQHVEKGGLAA